MLRMAFGHWMGDFQSAPILAQLSPKCGQNRHSVYGWECAFCILPNGNASSLYMVAVSSRGICPFRGRMEWDVLHLECSFDKLFNQMVYTQIRWTKSLPQSLSLLFGACAWRLYYRLRVEHHWTYFQHARL